MTAYGVLSRGLLSGSRPIGARDLRSYLPRFREENLAQNQRLVEELKRLADEVGFRPSQLAIAWALAKGEKIVPVIGARTRSQLSDSLEAIHVKLSAENLARIEETIPATAAAGTRYDEHHMKMLDK